MHAATHCNIHAKNGRRQCQRNEEECKVSQLGDRLRLCNSLLAFDNAHVPHDVLEGRLSSRSETADLLSQFVQITL